MRFDKHEVGEQVALFEQESIIKKGRVKPKQSRAGNQYVPQGHDLCQTPPYALTPLLPYIDSQWDVWECASGKGRLADSLDKHLIKPCIRTDLQTGYNFFEYAPFWYDMICTNPPYSIKYKFMKRCYELDVPFALLVPVETIAAKSAQVLMKKYGFEIMLLSDRVDFDMPNKGYAGSSTFPVLWFCHKLLPEKIMFGEITEEKRIFEEKLKLEQISNL